MKMQIQKLLSTQIRKEILFESEDETEINKLEPKFILEYKSNNPKVGYNRWPKFRDGKQKDV